jgi:hypothetical protein
VLRHRALTQPVHQPRPASAALGWVRGGPARAPARLPSEPRCRGALRSAAQQWARLAVRALSIVSAVVKVFDTTTTRVVSASSPARALTASTGSTLARKTSRRPAACRGRRMLRGPRPPGRRRRPAASQAQRLGPEAGPSERPLKGLH